MEKEKAEEGLATTEEGSYSPFVSSDHGVSLLYPEHWTKVSGYLGTIVSFLIPEDETAHTTLNLLTQELPPGTTLEDYSTESIKHLQEMMTYQGTFKVWDGVLFGQKGKKMQFAIDLGTVSVQVFQAWTVSNDQAYIITFSSPSHLHDSFREQVEQVMNSTKFIKKTEPKQKPIELLCFKHYENTTHSFRVRFPRTWIVKEPQREGGPVVQAKFDDDTQGDVIRTLAADVTISPLPVPSWGVSEYKEIALMRLGDLAGGEENIQLKDTRMGGQEAIQARYTSTSAGTTNLHIFTVKDGKAYNLAFSTNMPIDDTRPYPIFARILSSFKFLPPEFTSKKELLVLEHLVRKISFEFPEEGWIPSETIMMTTVSFEHLPNKEETMPRSNVNLVINDLAILPSSSRSLEGFNKFMQEQLEANVEGLCLINARAVKMAGCDARELHYQGTVGDKRIGCVQSFTLSAGKAYVISFSALLENFETELELARPIISSFTIL